MHPDVYRALFTIVKCPLIDTERIKKMGYRYTTEYYSAIKKEQNLAICNNMDGAR